VRVEVIVYLYVQSSMYVLSVYVVYLIDASYMLEDWWTRDLRTS
jgi:hypothetical protein